MFELLLLGLQSWLIMWHVFWLIHLCMETLEVKEVQEDVVTAVEKRCINKESFAKMSKLVRLALDAVGETLFKAKQCLLFQ